MLWLHGILKFKILVIVIKNKSENRLHSKRAESNEKKFTRSLGIGCPDTPGRR